MSNIYVLRSPVSTGDTTLQKAPQDDLVVGAGDGVRFLADLTFPASYPAGPRLNRPAAGAPANGAVVGDLSGNANGSVVVASGQTVSYAGGGFDYSALTAAYTYLSVPASVAADLWATVGGKTQEFLACQWVRLPSESDWNTEAVLYPMLTWAADLENYSNGAEIVLIAQQTGKVLTFRRQTAVGSVATALTIGPATADYGSLAQIAYWRNSSGVGARLRTASNTHTQTAAAGAANSANFSALTGKLGPASSYANGGFGALRTRHAAAANYRLYRAWFENLARSNRDPISVLNADWDRTHELIAASAAANGGTSLIYV